MLRSFLHVSLHVLLLSWTFSAYGQAPPEEQQIGAALSAAPEELREDATVLGYEQANGILVPLRARDGSMICLADDPSDDRFHVACYHRSLEPFMERGRVLRREGLSGDEVDAIRRNEIEEGSLTMPDQAAALYSLTGPADSYDPSSGEVSDVRSLHVVYVPGATLESTGLPSSAPAGTPWLMAPGTPWAHIMYVPRD